MELTPDLVLANTSVMVSKGASMEKVPIDPKTVLSVFCLVSTAIIFPASTAFADSTLNCEAYVKSATAQHKRNVDLGCGFSGNRWTSNVWLHNSWCQSPDVKIQHITAEQVAREQALSQCLKNKAKVNQLQDAAKKSKCRNYANTAVNLGKKNKQYGCGFSDRRYSPNYQGHFEWCMTVPHTTANAEIAKSKKSIDGCIKKNAAFRYEKPQPPYCNGTCSLDMCWEAPGKKCRSYAADLFCKAKGHRKHVSYKSGRSIITNRWDGSSCSGGCGYFTRIVCKGTR